MYLIYQWFKTGFRMSCCRWEINVLKHHNLLNQDSKCEGLIYSFTPQFWDRLSFNSVIVDWLQIDTGTVISTYPHSIQGAITPPPCLKFWSHHWKLVVYILNRYLSLLLICTYISSVCSVLRSPHTYNPIILVESIITNNMHTLEG